MSLDLGREGLLEVAAADDLEIVEALEDELFIDIDSKVELKTHHYLITVLTNNTKAESIEKLFLKDSLLTKSNGGNTHVYIKMQHKLPLVERVALQACLGSDRTRELLSMLRVYVNGFMPVCFLETKDEAKRVMNWRKVGGTRQASDNSRTICGQCGKDITGTDHRGKCTNQAIEISEATGFRNVNDDDIPY